jgi:hypothetical protein
MARQNRSGIEIDTGILIQAVERRGIPAAVTGCAGQAVPCFTVKSLTTNWVATILSAMCLIANRAGKKAAPISFLSMPEGTE